LVYQAVSPSPGILSGYLIDGGLLTISRFPITEQRFQPFRFGVLSDTLAMKGVLYTRIELEKERTLHLFNTHLQASYADTEIIVV
jgi:sphingomyelin phosphodiesterase